MIPEVDLASDTFRDGGMRGNKRELKALTGLGFRDVLLPLYFMFTIITDLGIQISMG